MTTPITPMSASEIIRYMEFVSPGVGRIVVPDISVQQEPVLLRDFIQHALASHLAYVMEKMPVYVTEKVAQSGAVAYVNEDPELVQRNIGVDACRAVLQSEIDELTK